MNAVQKMIELMKARGIPINNPLEPQDTGEPVMDEINQLFPIQPQSQTFTFVQDDGSIIELAVNTKPVDMMTPFEVIDEQQKNYISMQLLESRASLAPQDLLQARVLAGLLLEAWTRSGLDASAWQVLQALLVQMD